jgi:ABC-type Na+ efflux pump permease subunit
VAGSFSAFFGEQQYDELLLISIVGAVIYGVLLAGLAVTERRRWGRNSVRFFAASIVSVVLFVVALTLYQAVAHYYRFDPPGSELERSLEGFDEWKQLARAGFVALYLVALALTAALGYALGRRFVALASTGALLVFMVGTFVFVDTTNACDVGFGFFAYNC